MGRRRGYRTKREVLTNLQMKIDPKRNRNKRMRQKREANKEFKTERIKQNQQRMDRLLGINSSKQEATTSMIKGINQNFIDRVHRVQTSYNSLIAACDKAQGVIFVLDARDPQSCRSLELESHILSQNKKIFFVISKIDLVPLEAAEGWMHNILQISQTIAANLTDLATSKPLVDRFLAEVAADCQSLAVVGVPGVGKSTLCKLGGEKLIDTEKWQWTNCNNSLSLIGSIEWRGRMRELLVDFIERIEGEELYTILGTKPQKSVGDLIHILADRNGLSKEEVPEFIEKKILNGEIKWFAVAPQTENGTQPSEEQSAALKSANASSDQFVKVKPGNPITIDSKALDFEFPVEEEDEGEDDNEVEEAKEEKVEGEEEEDE